MKRHKKIKSSLKLYKKEMKKIKKAIIIIILMAGVGTTTFFVGRQIGLKTDTSSTSTTIEEVTVGKQNIKKTLTSSGEIKTANTEKLAISTSYYFETMCVEEDDTIKKGENILKYTNGTYLVAPYDCVITEISIPETGERCINEHYVKIASNNSLSVQIKVDESKINSVSLGQSASVSISAFEDKTLDAVVTNISSTASNGKFTVIVDFDNDGDVMLGMTADVTI